MDAHKMEMVLEAIKKSMVLVLISDRQGRESEYAALQNAYWEITGQALSTQDLKAEIQDVNQYGFSELEHILKSLRWTATPGEKSMILRAAVAVAFADCHFHPSELEMVNGIGAALGLAQQEIMLSICTSD